MLKTHLQTLEERVRTSSLALLDELLVKVEALSFDRGRHLGGWRCGECGEV
jgi:hypothetical protein